MTRKGSSFRRAFTLVEVLVSMALVALLVGILLTLLWEAQRTYTISTKRLESFREARTAFETLSRTLGQASLRPYWDYDDANDPKNYVRRSELRFRSGRGLLPAAGTPRRGITHSIFFQAPFGDTADPSYARLENTFNSCGFFLEYGDDNAYRPPFLNAVLPAQNRFRLMQWLQPTEEWDLFPRTSGNPGYASTDWFTSHLGTGQTAHVHVVADNVVALVLRPRLAEAEDPSGTALAPNYDYRSAPASWPPATTPQPATENQLPPIVDVTMVVLDEASATRLEALDPDPVSFLGLGALFQNAADFESDLETLKTTLVDQRLSYEVFSTSVDLKSAR